MGGPAPSPRYIRPVGHDTLKGGPDTDTCKPGGKDTVKAWER